MKTLREIIKERNLTNRAVAEALKISETNIRRYDDLSKRNVDELSKIAKAINVSLSDLLDIIYDHNNIIKNDNICSTLYANVPIKLENIENPALLAKEPDSQHEVSGIQEPVNQKAIEQLIENNTKLVDTNQKLVERILELIEKK